MQGDELKRWRGAERARLVAAREALDRETLESWRQQIDRHLIEGFSRLSRGVLAFCWPIRSEYDARHVARMLRERGALTVLPAIVAKGEPLVFREWHPGVPLASGPLDIAYPVSSREAVPDHVLLPMNGWDEGGYRLGYGAGYFDRTLASLERKPLVIGVSYEIARMPTIHPQSWDIPMDWVVTERGAYRREPTGLVPIGRAAG
ncbi:MAG: 5-formyltetrahydrofolate cyclo-ligase [Burkholderiales bacterium]